MSEDNLIGQRLDEYKLDKLLGQGGMARVYRALDVRLKRWVAIKVIDPPFRKDASYLARFEREAQAIAQLQHPNIVSIYRYGDANDMLYMAMQFIEGSPLDSVISGYHSEGNLIPIEEARRIIREVCLALDYAHKHGVIHRDVKPANIILDKQGNAILADFGLVLMEEHGTQGEIFGTPHYIAPEQAISSAGAVPQSDLYAVGVIMYEMFTGVVPFDGSDPLEVAMQHMTNDVPPPRETNPEISEALEAVILKSLAKEPADRYATGELLMLALDKALAQRRKSSSHILDSRLSVVYRVDLDLAANPLPPLPAGMTAPAPMNLPPMPPVSVAPPPPPAQSQVTPPPPQKSQMTPPPQKSQMTPPPQQSQTTPPQQSQMTPPPQQSQTTPPPASPSAQPAMPPFIAQLLASVPPDKLPFVYAGMGAAAILLIVGLGFLLTRGGDETKPVANATVTVVATQVANNAPATSAEVAPPVVAQLETQATLAPALVAGAPVVLADTLLDFSNQKSGKWQYLWSKANDNKWKALDKYSDNHYGDPCWYVKKQEHIRICNRSGHPGKKEDVAWVWVSPVSGPILGQLVMHKIDNGGDGVEIKLFHVIASSGEAKQLLTQDLDGNQSEAVQQPFTIDAVNPGDTLFFVIGSNGNSDADHTAFRARICQNSCPVDTFEVK